MDLRTLENFSSTFKNTKRLPVLFTSHGNPMDMLSDTSLFRVLKQQGEDIGNNYELNAVLIISAHWNTKGTFVNISEFPDTIYDFYGFPEEFYKVKYNAPGSPVLANEVAGLSEAINPTTEWGFDHGSWPILRHLFPSEDVPVVQMSMDYDRSPLYHYELAGQLKKLRERGILIIGSGSIVHNLQLAMKRIMARDLTPFGWDIEFEDWVMKKLDERDFKSLINYKDSKLGYLAAPTPDHYVPMLYSLGVVDKNEPIVSIHKNMFAGFSDRSFRVG